MEATPAAPAQRKWTDEQRQHVKAMLAKGATASMVAREMHINRNQALGRIWRDAEMSLIGYKKHTNKSAARKAITSTFSKPSNPKPHGIPPIARAKVSPPGDVAISKPIQRDPPPLPVNVVEHPMPLIGTGRRWCKWPVATAPDVLGGFLCCGASTLPHDVYCPKHRQISAAPPWEHRR